MTNQVFVQEILPGFWTCLKRKFNEKARKRNTQYVEAEEIKGKKQPCVSQPTLARNSDFLRKAKSFGFMLDTLIFFLNDDSFFQI